MAGERTEGARKGRVAAVLATLAAPVVGWFIFRSAAASMMPAAVLVAHLPPEDHGPALKVAMRLVQVPQQRVTPEMIETAREGLAAEPLAFEPFYIAARAEEQAGRLARATELMEEARRRRPTHSAIRMQLLVYYTQAQRYEQALAEMDLLLRRNEDLRRALIPEVVKLLPVPEGRAALASILATEPEWRDFFFEVAAAQKVNPAHARALHDLIAAKRPGADLRLERQLVLQSLAGSGDYAGARRQWLSALPAGERGRHPLLFDGDFAGAAALKPFGWDLASLDVGRAEIVGEGERSYLDAVHFGGRDVELASQTLALPPGRYTLRTAFRSEEAFGERRLTWRLTCLPSGDALGAIDLGRAGAGGGRLEAGFEVPAGCAGQRLALVGAVGDTTGVAAADIDSVEIVR